MAAAVGGFPVTQTPNPRRRPRGFRRARVLLGGFGGFAAGQADDPGFSKRRRLSRLCAPRWPTCPSRTRRPRRGLGDVRPTLTAEPSTRRRRMVRSVREPRVSEKRRRVHPTRASAPESTSILAAPLRDTRGCPRAAIPPPRTPPARARAARTPQPRQTPETAISLGSSSLSSAEATDAMEPESERRCDSRPRSLSFRAERTMCICDAASLSMNESAGRRGASEGSARGRTYFRKNRFRAVGAGC